MSELRIAVTYYVHKSLNIAGRDEEKGRTIGQQIDAHIVDTMRTGLRTEGGPLMISGINLEFEIGDQHKLMEQLMRAYAAGGSKAAKAL